MAMVVARVAPDNVLHRVGALMHWQWSARAKLLDAALAVAAHRQFLGNPVRRQNQQRNTAAKFMSSSRPPALRIPPASACINAGRRSGHPFERTDSLRNQHRHHRASSVVAFRCRVLN